jgi:NNP family nitrate/nitrite transporter-like MFS transporter
LGGIVSDRIGNRYGFNGKISLLSILLLLEGAGIMIFAHSGELVLAIMMMFFFGLCLKMANGATYSIVPFINQKAVGSVAGIVGAGGNVGAMLIGFLFKSMPYTEAFFYLGCTVFTTGLVILATRILIRKQQTVNMSPANAESEDQSLIMQTVAVNK